MHPFAVQNGVAVGHGWPVVFFKAYTLVFGSNIIRLSPSWKLLIVGFIRGGVGGRSLHLWVFKSKLLQVTHFFVQKLKYWLLRQEIQLDPSKKGVANGHVDRYPVVWSVFFTAFSTWAWVLLPVIQLVASQFVYFPTVRLPVEEPTE